MDRLRKWTFKESGLSLTHVELSTVITEIEKRSHVLPADRAQLAETLLTTVAFHSFLEHEGELTLQLHKQDDDHLVVGKCSTDGAIRGLISTSQGQRLTFLTPYQLVLTYHMKITQMPAQSIINLTKPTVIEAIKEYLLLNKGIPSLSHRLIASEQSSLYVIQVERTDTHLDYDALFVGLSPLEDPSKWASQDRLLAELEGILDESPQIATDQSLHFACHCDREKMLNAVKVMGEAEALSIFEENRYLDVTCSYCHKQMSFTEDEIRALFVDRGPLH